MHLTKCQKQTKHLMDDSLDTRHQNQGSAIKHQYLLLLFTRQGSLSWIKTTPKIRNKSFNSRSHIKIRFNQFSFKLKIITKYSHRSFHYTFTKHSISFPFFILTFIFLSHSIHSVSFCFISATFYTNIIIS